MQNDYYWQDQEWSQEPRRPSRLWVILLLLLALLSCSAVAVLVPGALGFLAGYGQLQAQNHENAIQHFQRGLGYLAEEYPELAHTEFEMALRYDSSYEPARDKLRELNAALAGNTDQGAQEENRAAAGLYEEARGLVAEKKWSDAINRLEQLRALNPAYRTVETNDLLYQSYVASGYEAKTGGQIELARERFDAAIAIRNSDAEVQRQRDLAMLYLDAQQAVGYNWKQAIDKFDALYKQDPNYDNVKQRLAEAHENYGDIAMRQNASCLAVREYDSALALVKDAQLSDKRSQAMVVCRAAVLVTPSPSAAGGNYVARMSTATARACNTGVGDVSGVVRDALGQPLAGIYVAYYADGVNRITTRTDANGQYSFTWGTEAGLFHVVVLATDGKTPAGVAADVSYPGASRPGCHIIVDWQKI